MSILIILAVEAVMFICLLPWERVGEGRWGGGEVGRIMENGDQSLLNGQVDCEEC